MDYEPQAQTAKNKKVSQVVSVNLLPILFTSFNVSYERAMIEKWSIVASIDYSESKSMFNNKNATWVDVTIDAQRYTREVCQGFYIAPYVKHRNMSYHKTVSTNPSNSIYLGYSNVYHDQTGVGAKIGYQKISKWGIGFNMFMGAGIYPIHFKNGVEDEDVSFFDLRLGLSLAYGF